MRDNQVETKLNRPPNTKLLYATITLRDYTGIVLVRKIGTGTRANEAIQAAQTLIEEVYHD